MGNFLVTFKVKDFEGSQEELKEVLTENIFRNIEGAPFEIGELTLMDPQDIDALADLARTARMTSGKIEDLAIWIRTWKDTI